MGVWVGLLPLSKHVFSQLGETNASIDCRVRVCKGNNNLDDTFNNITK